MSFKSDIVNVLRNVCKGGLLKIKVLYMKPYLLGFGFGSVIQVLIKAWLRR